MACVKSVKLFESPDVYNQVKLIIYALVHNKDKVFTVTRNLKHLSVLRAYKKALLTDGRFRYKDNYIWIGSVGVEVDKPTNTTRILPEDLDFNPADHEGASPWCDG